MTKKTRGYSLRYKVTRTLEETLRHTNPNLGIYNGASTMESNAHEVFSLRIKPAFLRILDLQRNT